MSEFIAMLENKIYIDSMHVSAEDNLRIVAGGVDIGGTITIKRIIVLHKNLIKEVSFLTVPGRRGRFFY